MTWSTALKERSRVHQQQRRHGQRRTPRGVEEDGAKGATRRTRYESFTAAWFVGEASQPAVEAAAAASERPSTRQFNFLFSFFFFTFFLFFFSPVIYFVASETASRCYLRRYEDYKTNIQSDLIYSIKFEMKSINEQ